MSEKLRVVVNAGSNGLNFAITVAVTFFVQPILVLGLGDERFGIWLLVNTILAYMALGDLGIGAAVLRYVARFDGLQDHDSTNRIFSASLSLFAGVGLLLLVVTGILAFGWPCPLGVEPHLAYDTRWLLTLLGINLAFGLPLDVFRTILEGHGRYPTINAIRVVGLIIRSALFVTIVYAGEGLIAIGVAITICSLTQNAVYAFFAWRCLPSLRFSILLADRAAFRMIWGYSAHMFTAQSAWRIADYANPLILNMFLGPAAITYYSIAANLTSQAGDAVRQMMQVITPTVSRWEGRGDFDAIRALWLVGSRYVLYLAMPIQLGLICFGYPFLSLWMGDHYPDLSYATLVILALPLPLTLTYSLAGRILQGIGRVGWFSALAVLRSAATIVLAVVMVHYWGIVGVATATSVVITLHSVAMTVVVCRVTTISLPTLVARAYLKPVLLSTLLLPLWVSGQRILPPTGWSQLIVVGIAGLLLYGVAALVADRPLRESGLTLLAAVRRMRSPGPRVTTVSVVPLERKIP